MTIRKLTGRRKQALKKYYENPNLCNYCHKVIEVRPHDKIQDVKRKKFCDRSCASAYNNQKYPKRTAISSGKCEDCGTVVTYTRYSSGNFYKRKRCNTCNQKRRRLSLSTKNQKSKNNGFNTGYLIEETTKGELRERNNSWTAFRAAITKNARELYSKSERKKTCLLCDYDHHAPICHLRSVSDFPDSATVKEINALENLVALCPNHHWDLDHGFLDKEELIRLIKLDIEHTQRVI
jgi:hypothetical protein